MTPARYSVTRHNPSLCHPNRIEHARGLCDACYRRKMRAENPTIREREHLAHQRWYALKGHLWRKDYEEKNRDRIRKQRHEYNEKMKNDPTFKMKKRAGNLRRNYGINMNQYETLYLKQGGKCALCLQPVQNPKLCVDHDHRTNGIRGLLCKLCNQFLGQVERDPLFLQRVGGYLNASKI